ncbi:unnamed protein product [Porites evermanni]|uniref:Uncharacterized protein n=1 Tax=Porites evermanni TaxID=104178 RepID=A0ABN8QK62_9CNID|nr:unnamed protein product [Porites evermanni]
MSNTNPDNQQGNQALIDTENYIKKGCEIIQREATRVRHEQESIDAMSKKLDQVHFSSTVKLNVGGQYFTTSVQTLKKDPNSMLAAMFSGKFEMKPSEDGSFFIDRDGTYFRFILNYLRNGELILPEGATFLKELEAEAKFYQLQGILDELKPKEPKVFEETVILTNEEHRRVMKSWLPEAMKGEWRLLFRASRDGFAASAFHSKCDNKGPTITVVKSGGNIFGGFSENAWTSRCESVSCRHAFLFSFVNPSGLGPTKLPLISGIDPNGIVCISTLGPVFGIGNDLVISNNADESPHSNSQLGHTYQLPPGQQSTFFTGAKNFTVTDYEVFGLSQ